jgi:hypothetical protein
MSRDKLLAWNAAILTEGFHCFPQYLKEGPEHHFKIKSQFLHFAGRDSAEGMTTRYGLDGPGIECRWTWDFPHTSRSALGTTHPLVQWAPRNFRGIKRSGRGIDHAPPSSAEVKERVELGWTLPLRHFISFSIHYSLIILTFGAI